MKPRLAPQKTFIRNTLGTLQWITLCKKTVAAPKVTCGRTVCQDSSLHQTLDLFSKDTVMQLSNDEVIVNKDSCSQFFLKAEVKGSAFFFFFFPPHIHLSVTPSLGMFCMTLPLLHCLPPPVLCSASNLKVSLSF